MIAASLPDGNCAAGPGAILVLDVPRACKSSYNRAMVVLVIRIGEHNGGESIALA